MPNITNITPPRVPIVNDKTGYMTREWYRFFYNMFYATGGENGGAVPVDRGGTGTTVVPTNGQLLVGNSTTNAYSVANLGTGAGIAKTVGAGSLSIANTGVLSVIAGQGIDVDQPTGDVTVSVGTQPYLDFDTTPSYTDQLGRIGWNESDQTLNIGMEYGVVQQVGEETYARVRNSTGVTIPNGTAVGFAGAATDALEVAPYIADGSQPTLYILGIMTHDLPDTGEKGYCTTWGFVRDVDTSAFSQGDVLYVSTTVAGELTNVKPTAPNNVIPIAAVVNVGATDGVIFVRPTIEQQSYYGVFSRTTDYSPAATNTAYAIQFDTTRISNGVVIGSPTSRIVVPESGLYDVSVTLQYSSGSSSAKDIYSWIRKNGTDISQSSRIISLSGSGTYSPVLVSEAISFNANDYIEIMFASTSTNVSLNAVPATAFAPGSPAANLIIEQIQQ